MQKSTKLCLNTLILNLWLQMPIEYSIAGQSGYTVSLFSFPLFTVTSSHLLISTQDSYTFSSSQFMTELIIYGENRNSTCLGALAELLELEAVPKTHWAVWLKLNQVQEVGSQSLGTAVLWLPWQDCWSRETWGQSLPLERGL